MKYFQKADVNSSLLFIFFTLVAHMFPLVIHLLFDIISIQGQEVEAAAEETKKSNHVTRKLEKRKEGRTLDPHIEEQFGSGRLLACISSRPGQCGRADGYEIMDLHQTFLVFLEQHICVCTTNFCCLNHNGRFDFRYLVMLSFLASSYLLVSPPITLPAAP